MYIRWRCNLGLMIRMSTSDCGSTDDISNLKDNGRLIRSVPAESNTKNKSLLNLSARVQNLMNAPLDNEEPDGSVNRHEVSTKE